MRNENRKVLFTYLSAVGIANVSGWIYLLSVNLLIFERTGSALAVAGLYMIKPFAHMIVGSWVGSVIDRVSTKHMMIVLDFLRAFLVLSIVFIDSIWIIYVFVLFIQMASATFEHASFVYMTRLLPKHARMKFNALISLVHSGAFVLGPALTGLLFVIGTLEMALFVNVGTFILSAGVMLLLPNINSSSSESTTVNFRAIRNDWGIVWNFSKIAFPFVVVYMVFQGVMLLTAALDSMEVAFAKEVLHLSNAAYGSLVSVAGIGFLTGAAFTNGLVRILSAKQLMNVGTLCVSFGYLIYSLSTTYLVASIGFFVLCFFLSLANTGFITFIQEHIPVDMMGRISSLYGLVSHSIQLLVVLVMGVFADWFSVKEVVFSGSLLMLVVSLYLTVKVSRLKEQILKSS